MGNVAFCQPASKYDSIDISVKNHMSEKKVPGFIACIVKDNGIIWSNSYGQADIRNNIPMSMDAIMNIGSISKTFTATAAMQLWEKGLIDLDADISEYLDFKIRNPKYPDKPITIYQILIHTSSIRDGNAYVESYSCGDPSISLKEWIHNYLTSEGKYYDQNENFCDWSPGSNHRYSNVAFGILGLIVEEVAQQPFNEYCMNHIFEPLGMKNTGWFLSEIDINNHIKPYAYVTEHNRGELLQQKNLFPNETGFTVGSTIENCLYSFPNYPDGLVRTSVRELSYFLIAMMNGGEFNGSKILNKSTIDKMLSLQAMDNKSQGLCWHTFEFESLWGHILLWGHAGGDPGIATCMFFNPENKIGMITFQNNSTEGAYKILTELYLTTQGK
jgi:CubicO group peptidase (beta-lactamase class C family)